MRQDRARHIRRDRECKGSGRKEAVSVTAIPGTRSRSCIAVAAVVSSVVWKQVRARTTLAHSCCMGEGEQWPAARAREAAIKMYPRGSNIATENRDAVSAVWKVDGRERRGKEALKSAREICMPHANQVDDRPGMSRCGEQPIFHVISLLLRLLLLSFPGSAATTATATVRFPVPFALPFHVRGIFASLVLSSISPLFLS